MNIQKVTCILHGKEFLGIDTLKFKICCKKCIELNLENKESNLTKNENIKKEIIIEESVQEIYCSKHQGEKALFFCDDCNDFLCNSCFANGDCRKNHYSNMPILISKNLKELVSQLISSLNEIHLEETLKIMQELNNKIKNEKKDCTSKNSLLKINIVKALKEKSSFIIQNYIDLFGGFDKECEDVYQRVEAYTKKINKNIYEVSDYLKTVENYKSDLRICLSQNDKKNSLLNIKKFIEDSNHFFKVKILDTKERISHKSKEIKNVIEKYSKNQQTFENSVVSSIISGITSQSIRIRRFIKFDMMCKYYKTTSLVLKTDRAISLVGLGLCGLYPMKVIKQVY